MVLLFVRCFFSSFYFEEGGLDYVQLCSTSCRSESLKRTDLYLHPITHKSIHQPMDLGIISAGKTLYRSQMLRSTMAQLESRQLCRGQSDALQTGVQGMSEWFDPHMFDISTMVKSSWDMDSEATVARCSKNPKLFPRLFKWT